MYCKTQGVTQNYVIVKTKEMKDNKETIKIIGKIANRAVAINPDYNKTTVMMDLLVLYDTGMEMRWDEFLNAPVFDFIHDINGINQHLNRKTYVLEDGFWPRYAK